MEIAEGGGPQRTGMRKVVVVVPSAFTLANLFFGFWAIVSAFTGAYERAGWFIVVAGLLDGLDGRVARASNTGSRFGAELDSLVDVISFGVAPAMLIFFEELTTAGKFAWIPCFLYVVCAAIRLARYNVTAGHGGRPSAWFTGLPSPAAGVTLAMYYSFSQTPWYRSSALAYLNNGHQVVVPLMLLLGLLMVSNVKYPRFPSAGIRTRGQLAGLLTWILIFGGSIAYPKYFLFPLGITFVGFGILRAVALNLAERGEEHRPAHQPPVTLLTPSRTHRRVDRRRREGE